MAKPPAPDFTSQIVPPSSGLTRGSRDMECAKPDLRCPRVWALGSSPRETVFCGALPRHPAPMKSQAQAERHADHAHRPVGKALGVPYADVGAVLVVPLDHRHHIAVVLVRPIGD